MNIRVMGKSLGIVLGVAAVAMVPSLLLCFVYQEEVWPLATSVALLAGLGLVLSRIPLNTAPIYGRDGFAIVAFSWLALSFFGALPFYFSGVAPTMIDAFFESASGFTTTGASILTQVESLPRGILFWRSSTHWLGGMGVLVLTLAILPLAGGSSLHILRAESTGPSPGKLVPKMRRTAMILYSLYIAFTVVQILLLMMAGMPLYDAALHTFGTVGTGGFSMKNASVGSYNNLAYEVIITVFMLVCSINFSLYYQLLKKNFKAALADRELWTFLGVAGASMLLIALNLRGGVFASFGEAFRHSSFQVASVISSTGYATTNFNLWPSFSKMILFMLMVMGASAGSTGGGLKAIRVLLLFKIARRSIIRALHPRSIHLVRLGDRVVEEETLTEVLTFFFIYCGLFAGASLLISLEGKDLITTLSSVVTTLSNIGPGFELVGPAGNFSSFSGASKLLLSFCMIAGRLELYPMLLLFAPSFWKRTSL